MSLKLGVPNAFVLEYVRKFLEQPGSQIIPSFPLLKPGFF